MKCREQDTNQHRSLPLWQIFATGVGDHSKCTT
jgi:hypothetical protein